MKYIYIMGKPCSGKGTVSSYLKYEFGYYHIPASKFLKKMLYNKNMSDELLKISLGEIINFNEFDEYILNEAKKYKDINIVFDGYPRSISQLNYIFKHHTGVNKYFILLDINNENVLYRASHRVICRVCDRVQNNIDVKNGKCLYCLSDDIYKRDDDNNDILNNRINAYDVCSKLIDNRIMEETNKENSLINTFVINVDNKTSQEVNENITKVLGIMI